MSSTNRGAVRHPDDFYETPAWCTWAVLPALECLGLRSDKATLLEPACGAGALLKVVREAWPEQPVFGFELDRDRAQKAWDAGFGVVARDALSAEPWEPRGLAMTNPPFSLALEFAQRGIAEGLNTLLLLRLNFLGSEDRVAFHKRHPAHIFVLGRRPSFGLNKHGKPGTDSCEYGWFGWGPSFVPGRWEMLDLAAVPAHARIWERRRGKTAKTAALAAKEASNGIDQAASPYPRAGRPDVRGEAQPAAEGEEPMMGLRLVIDEKHIEGLGGCAFLLAILAVKFGFYAMAAYLAQYAAEGLFRVRPPFWPLFSGLLVLGFLIEKAAPRKSMVSEPKREGGGS